MVKNLVEGPSLAVERPLVVLKKQQAFKISRFKAESSFPQNILGTLEVLKTLSEAAEPSGAQ